MLLELFLDRIQMVFSIFHSISVEIMGFSLAFFIHGQNDESNNIKELTRYISALFDANPRQCLEIEMYGLDFLVELKNSIS